MKKFVVAASFLALSFGAFAQDSSSEYKPVAGDVTAEVGLTGGLFNTNLSLNNLGNGGQLKFRYFIADKLAARLGFNISSVSQTEKSFGITPSEVGEIKGTVSALQFNLGIEKHLTGTERLSTYVGADLLLSFKNLKEKGEKVDGAGNFNANTSYELKGALQNSALNVGGVNAGTGFGLRAVVGAEYYFIPKVYLGTELGWGFLASSVKDVEAKFTASGTTTTTTVEGGKSFNLSPSVVAAVRLGFRF